MPTQDSAAPGKNPPKEPSDKAPTVVRPVKTPIREDDENLAARERAFQKRHGTAEPPKRKS